MKNIKDTLFDWRKHWFVNLLTALMFALPTIIIFIPAGIHSDYEVNKWYIYMAIVGITLGVHMIYGRLEDHEKTIEMMNSEIEKLKEEIGGLKKSTEI